MVWSVDGRKLCIGTLKYSSRNRIYRIGTKTFNWFAIEFKESAKSSCSRKLFHSLGDSMERCRPFSVLILYLVLYEEQLVNSEPVIKSNLLSFSPLFLHVSSNNAVQSKCHIAFKIT